MAVINPMLRKKDAIAAGSATVVTCPAARYVKVDDP